MAFKEVCLHEPVRGFVSSLSSFSNVFFSLWNDMRIPLLLLLQVAAKVTAEREYRSLVQAQQLKLQQEQEEEQDAASSSQEAAAAAATFSALEARVLGLQSRLLAPATAFLEALGLGRFSGALEGVGVEALDDLLDPSLVSSRLCVAGCL